MKLSRRPLQSAKLALDSTACISCQWRTFSTSYRQLADKPAATPVPSPLADAPRSYGKSVDEFTPKPLSRPIGLPNPPHAGENRGIDNRTWRQRRADFVDYDKHLVRREQLYGNNSTPKNHHTNDVRKQKTKDIYALFQRME